MKNIVTGESSFEDLILNGCLYVDKTKYFNKLVRKPDKYYFLSRPRRFGKSLTLSTLEAIFKGKRELFKGLYIDSTDYDWKEYPILHIDFSKCIGEDPADISSWINRQLIDIGSTYSIKLSKNDEYNYNLDILISRLATREKVVILIDEYDSLLTNNINNENIEDIRNTLRGFYSILKAQSANIRMCFIAGVTKFSKVSIFSAMNNLTDISMYEDYATMLGYTQNELEDNFSEYIEKGAQARFSTQVKYLQDIKTWYDGYCFAPEAESVYNPVSVGSFFNQGGKAFRNYWIQTGGMPYILTEVAKRVQFDISLDIETEVPAETLESPDLIQMVKTNVSKYNFLSLLYQTGYLTIKNAEEVGDSYVMKLGYPNKEVSQGLTQILLPLYLGSNANLFKGPIVLKNFMDGNINAAMTTLTSIFASIPYHQLVFNAENAWHASFLSMLTLMGAEIVAEEPTNLGRIDAVITCPKYIYIIEFKFNQSAAVAIEQIRQTRYFEKYLNAGKEIHLLGINFSTDQKNIVEYKDEVL